MDVLTRDRMLRLLGLELRGEPHPGQHYKHGWIPVAGEAVTEALGGQNDKLKLGSRIDLKPGENLASSRKIRTPHEDSWDLLAAEVDTPNGREVRLGVIYPDDSKHWAAGPDPKRQKRLDQIDAEIAALEGKDEAAFTQADEARLDALHEERNGLGVEGDEVNETITLTPSAIADLRAKIEPAVQQAREWSKNYKKFLDEHQAESDEIDSLWPLRNRWTPEQKARFDKANAVFDALGEPDPTFARGVIEGADGKAIGYLVEGNDDGEAGWDVEFGIRTPRNADYFSDGWSIGQNDDKAIFPPKALAGLLKELEELGPAASGQSDPMSTRSDSAPSTRDRALRLLGVETRGTAYPAQRQMPAPTPMPMMADPSDLLTPAEADRDYGSELDRFEFGDGDAIVARDQGVLTFESDAGDRTLIHAAPSPDEALEWADYIDDGLDLSEGEVTSEHGLQVTRTADGLLLRWPEGDEHADAEDLDGVDLAEADVPAFTQALRDMAQLTEDNAPDDEGAADVPEMDAPHPGMMRHRTLELLGVEVRAVDPKHPHYGKGVAGGKGGQFRPISAQIMDALKGPDGGGDPLAGFSQPQLKKAAEQLGLNPPKGMRLVPLKGLLMAHGRGEKPSAPDALKVPAKKAAAKRAPRASKAAATKLDSTEIVGKLRQMDSASDARTWLSGVATKQRLTEIAPIVGLKPESGWTKSQMVHEIVYATITGPRTLDQAANGRRKPGDQPDLPAVPSVAKKAAPKRPAAPKAAAAGETISAYDLRRGDKYIGRNIRVKHHKGNEGQPDKFYEGKLLETGAVTTAAKSGAITTVRLEGVQGTIWVDDDTPVELLPEPKAPAKPRAPRAPKPDPAKLSADFAAAVQRPMPSDRDRLKADLGKLTGAQLADLAVAHGVKLPAGVKQNKVHFLVEHKIGVVLNSENIRHGGWDSGNLITGKQDPKNARLVEIKAELKAADARGDREAYGRLHQERVNLQQLGMTPADAKASAGPAGDAPPSPTTTPEGTSAGLPTWTDIAGKPHAEILARLEALNVSDEQAVKLAKSLGVTGTGSLKTRASSFKRIADHMASDPPRRFDPSTVADAIAGLKSAGAIGDRLAEHNLTMSQLRAFAREMTITVPADVKGREALQGFIADAIANDISRWAWRNQPEGDDESRAWSKAQGDLHPHAPKGSSKGGEFIKKLFGGGKGKTEKAEAPKVDAPSPPPPPRLTPEIEAARRNFAHRTERAAINEHALAAVPAKFSYDLEPGATSYRGKGKIDGPNGAGSAAALEAYQVEDYEEINQALRGPGEDDVSDEVAEIDKTMAVSRLQQDVVVHRVVRDGSDVFGDAWNQIERNIIGSGTTSERIANFQKINDWRKAGWFSDATGMRFVDHGFVSTSAGEDWPKKWARQEDWRYAEPVMFKILVPQGTGGVQLSETGEMEILLERGLSFEIVQDHGPDESGLRHLDLRVVTDGEP